MSGRGRKNDQSRHAGPRRRRGRSVHQARRGPRRRREAEDLRAAAVLRGLSPRPPLLRSTRHHRADLRHLPRRLPDECRARHRACLGSPRSTPPCALLRRLFYCGEWIESHALHVYMLHAPDFLGYPDAIAMARDHRAVVEQALRLKKIGNRIVQLLGGREIHPISAAVGGFYKMPTKQQLRDLAERSGMGARASLETVRWTAAFEFPDFEQDYEFVALASSGRVPLERRPPGVESRTGHRRRGIRRPLSSSSTSSTRTRCTPSCAGEARIWWGRWRGST